MQWGQRCFGDPALEQANEVQQSKDGVSGRRVVQSDPHPLCGTEGYISINGGLPHEPSVPPRGQCTREHIAISVKLYIREQIISRCGISVVGR